MGRRIGQLVAAVVLPGVAEILRGHLAIGTLGALVYCGCWHVMLVGFWLLPEQFPAWIPTIIWFPSSVLAYNSLKSMGHRLSVFERVSISTITIPKFIKLFRIIEKISLLLFSGNANLILR